MLTTYQNMARLGVVHFMAFAGLSQGEGPIMETLEQLAADEFFTAVEMRRPLNAALAKDIAALLGGAHMDVGVGAQPALLGGKLNLNALDEGERQKAVAEVRQSIDFAYRVGARICAVLTGPDPGAGKREQALEQLRRSLVELCRYASQKATGYELWVSLETFDRDIDKKCLLGPSLESADLAAKVKESVSNFGLLVDLSHLPLLKEDITEALTVTADHLIHVHAGNCVMRDASDPAYGDQHPPFGIPQGENGVEELREFIESLIYVGYFSKAVPTSKPFFTFEVKPLPGMSSAAALGNIKRTFLEAWAGVGGGLGASA
jgi:sugar phosphate isomerase/epimerase